jgi:hypothetical protein
MYNACARKKRCKGTKYFLIMQEKREKVVVCGVDTIVKVAESPKISKGI